MYFIFQYCCESDNDDEVVNLEPIYESSKSYHHRQLPDVIGTTDFLVSNTQYAIHYLEINIFK